MPIQRASFSPYYSRANQATHRMSFPRATPGQLIVAVWSSGSTYASAAPGTWTSRSTAVDFCEVRMLEKVATGNETYIDVTVNASTTLGGGVLIYSYVAASPFDVQASANTNGASPVTGTTGSTAQADSVAVAIIANVQSQTYSAVTNSFTTVAALAIAPGTTDFCLVLEKVLTATGTQSSGATSGSVHHSGCIAVFKGGNLGIPEPAQAKERLIIGGPESLPRTIPPWGM